MNTSNTDSSLTVDVADRPRKRWKWSTIFGVIVIALIVTLAAAWIGFGVWARHRLDAQLAAIRDAGEPMTWRDLSGPVETTEAGREYIAAFQRMVEIDEFMNTEVLRYKRGPGSFGYEGEDEGIIDYEYAEDMYLYGESAGPSFEIMFEAEAAADSWDDEPERLDVLLDRFGDDDPSAGAITPEELATAADLVRLYEPVFAQLQQVGTMEPCVISLGSDKWDEADELSVSRAAAKQLALRGYVQLHKGQIDEAAETALAILRIRRIFGPQRSLMVHMVDRAIASIAFNLIAEMLRFGLPSEARLEQLQAAVRDVYQPEHLTRAMMGERINSFELIESARRTGDFPIEGLPGPIVVYFQGQYLQDMSQIVAGSRQPFPAVVDAMAIEPRGVISELFTFSMDRVAAMEGQVLAMLGSIEAGIAVEQYRRAQGSVPGSLDQLVPRHLANEPIDPFTGKQLLYRVEPGRYLIYSVGPDRSDEGGSISSPPRGNSPFREAPPDTGIEVRPRK